MRNSPIFLKFGYVEQINHAEFSEVSFLILVWLLNIEISPKN